MAKMKFMKHRCREKQKTMVQHMQALQLHFQSCCFIIFYVAVHKPKKIADENHRSMPTYTQVLLAQHKKVIIWAELTALPSVSANCKCSRALITECAK